MRSICFLLLVCVLLVAASSAALAQSQATTGAIQGTVTDPSGAAIPGATVVLRHAATGVERRLQTDSQGRFLAPLLEVGTYNVTISAKGFGTKTVEGYLLNLGQTITANVPLGVATTSETVTVTAEAPLLESTKASAAANVNSLAVSTLPLNGRRFLDLAYMTPGVIQEPERNQLSFAGQRGINSSINVDGADYNQAFFGGQRGGERTSDAYVLSQAAIQEFQVVRSGFAPEFGRSTGGVVNVITKSGTNQFHGEGFYYVRHKEFAPKTVFGDVVAPTRQQFGGTLGGPVRRDKTFFFASYDQQKQTQPYIIRFNTTAGLPADLLAQQGMYQSTNDVNTALGKIDHQLTANTHITGRYSFSRNNALNGTFTGVNSGVISNNGTEKDKTHSAVVNVNSVLRPTLLNELRTQYAYEARPRVNNGETMDFVNKAGPQVQVTGCCYFGGVSYLPIPEFDTIVQLADNVSWIKGGHNVKFGFDFNKAHVDQIFRGNWRGVYIFNNIQNFVDNLNKKPGAAPDQFRVFFSDGKFVASMYNLAGFVQDQWKVNRKLTMTYGFRWDATLYPQPIKPNPAIPQTSKIPNDRKQWQPRVGLSYDLLGNGKTIIRAATGLFYARTPMILTNQAFTANGNPDVGSSFTLNSAQYLAAQSVHPELVFPFVPNTDKASNASYLTAANIAGVKPDSSFFASNYQSPRAFHVTAGIDHELARNLMVGFEWVHANTVHLERIHDVNLFPPAVGLDGSVPPQSRPLYNTSVRPNTNYNVMRQMESSSRANYDGLTWTASRRFSRRFQIMSSYTLAWNHDDDSNERNYSGIANSDAYNFKQDWSWSRIDIRHRWVAGGTLEIPKGIQISGSAQFRTGLPFSPFTGVDSNKDSQFTDRPIINGVMLARNSFRQPNYFTTDMRVSKRFRITERHRIELMADMFNVFNRHNFKYQVSTNESSTTAKGSLWGTGQTPAAAFRTIYLADGTLNKGGADVYSPFQLQMALRYVF